MSDFENGNVAANETVVADLLDQSPVSDVPNENNTVSNSYIVVS